MQSNNKKPVVVGIGELLWDMLPTGKKAGGAPINFVYHVVAVGGGRICYQRRGRRWAGARNPRRTG